MSAREVESIFADIVERARAADPTNARTWFDALTVVRFDGGSIGIGCPDEASVRFLEQNCKANFTRIAQQITGHLVAVDFLIGNGSASGRTVEAAPPGPALHADYTFDNFVVGPSNRLAHASCVAVSQSLGATYNPLFLYGNAGLGKTHLLHAVCHEIRHRSHAASIQLLSCEEFVNRFIRAIEQGNMAGFHSQFRTVDALVIDDVQFLREREQSQEEFFHTFNAIYNNGRQIILSADSPPAEIPALEDRLVSRFNWGLVARIDPPSYETRIAIVQKKAHLRGLQVSDEIAEYIARQVQANIRELEGALTTIYALATTAHEPVTLELAQRALEGQIRLATRRISLMDIVEVVAKHFDVRLTDLQSKRRSRSITVPRQICMYLARSLTKHSLEEIGGHLGGRDHTTVMHACAKIAEEKQSDPKMQALLTELTRQITQTFLMCDLMERALQQDFAEDYSDPAAMRRSLRPALILSQRNIAEHTTFVRHLLVGLADESIPVALICPPGQNTESVTPAPAAVFTHPPVALPLMERVGVERLAGQLEKFRPTVLHCLCESRAGLTRRLARVLDLPYVLMINSLAKRICKLPLSTHRCARIVVPAEKIRASVDRALPRWAERIAQINIGAFVETDTICFTDPSRLPSIVVAHPLRRVSDFENFFDAIRSLRTDGREFMVAIMGTGPAEHHIRKLLVALDLSDIVTIVPVLDPWRSVVVAGDIFVQPQPSRTFSVFLLEAMAVGTAVAACWGGVDDLIIPNETAVVFEPDSEPSIRQALKQLLDEHDFARRLATTAQEHIRDHYSVSAMVGATMRVYLEAQHEYPQ